MTSPIFLISLLLDFTPRLLFPPDQERRHWVLLSSAMMLNNISCSRLRQKFCRPAACPTQEDQIFFFWSEAHQLNRYPGERLQEPDLRLCGLEDWHTKQPRGECTGRTSSKFDAAHLLPAARSLHGSRVHLLLVLLHRGLENLLGLRGTGHFITQRPDQSRAEETGAAAPPSGRSRKGQRGGGGAG